MSAYLPTMSPPCTTYRAAAHVRARAIQGAFVVLDLAGDLQYSMNELGARVWEQATRGADVEEIVRALVAEYRVEESQARADVERILGELVASGLLVQTLAPDAG
jgi:hypothetical protein